MRVSPDPFHYRVEGEELRLTLVNHTETAIVAVQPGDGSNGGSRTPILRFTARSSQSGQIVPPRQPEGGCGNINSLHSDEVFTVEPGASAELSGTWVDPWSGLPPGSYRVTLEYHHEPTLEWSGIPLGEHDAESMQKIQGSAPYRCVSAPFTLIVPKTR